MQNRVNTFWIITTHNFLSIRDFDSICNNCLGTSLLWFIQGSLGWLKVSVERHEQSNCNRELYLRAMDTR